MARGARKRRLVVLYAAYVLALALGVDVFAYRRYVGDLARRTPEWLRDFGAMCRSAGVEPSVLNDVGFLERPRPGRYEEFLPEKRPGVVRIGAFGGSATYGNEVGDGLDYPSQLGKLFKEKGYANVEVINFGNGWHGFPQAVRLWELLGRKYRLDFVLLGYGTFYDGWETTFNHALGAWPPYIHGRYVESGDDVAFVSPAGAYDFADRFAQYARFLPRRRYLRYDRRAPFALQSLSPGRELGNPFYYLSGAARGAELDVVRRRLLAKLTRASKGVLLLNYPEYGLPGAPPAGAVSSEFLPRRSFPIFGIEHLSGAGNRLVAEEFYEMLTGRPRLSFPELEVSPLPRRAAAPAPAAALDAFSRARLFLGGAPVAVFTELVLNRDDWREPVDFQKRGIRALAAFGDADPFDLLYVPLDAVPDPAARARLELETTAGRRELELGAAEPLDARAAIAVVPCAVEARGYPARLIVKADWLAAQGVAAASIRSGRVLLGGKVVLAAERFEDSIALAPVAGNFIAAKPEKDSFFDAERLPPRGTIELALDGKRPLRLPVAAWEKRRRSAAYDASALEYVVARSTADPSVAVVRARGAGR